MASRIVARAWFTGMLSCGVIITNDPINKREPFKARIGAVTGLDAVLDMNGLRDFGQKLDLRCASEIILRHGEWLYPELSIELDTHLLTESNKPANLGLEKEEGDG